ncbi:MAG: hypothetical protein K9M56_09775 [Victivallales bacterium]|nr:hypothetical protein [Victivallales bacterium]
MKDQQDYTLQENYRDDEINLIDIFKNLWRKRAFIIISSILAVLIIITAFGLYYLSQPKTQIANLEFSLNFSGYSQGEYPNGSKFSENDIIAPVVLRKVYNKNNLDKYFKDFTGFQDSISIYKNNSKLLFLNAEYKQKLSNKDLRQPDREKLESEYKSKKKAILNNANLKLSITNQFKLKNIPEEVLNKALRNILSSWLDFAVKNKGVNKYRMSILTDNVVSSKNLSGLNYIVICEFLKETITKLQKDIENISKIPGANTTTITQNNKKINLSDLQFKIDFLQNYELSPLISAVSTFRVTQQGELSDLFITSKINELKRKKQLLLNKKKIYSEAIKNTVQIQSEKKSDGRETSKNDIVSQPVAQLDGTFLNKIVNMVQKDKSLQYRQTLSDKEISTGLDLAEIENRIKYYKQLLNADKVTQKIDNRKGFKNNKQINTLVIDKIKLIQDRTRSLIADANLFYKKLYENLYPQSTFYKIKSFTSESVKSLSLRKTLIFIIISLILVEVLIIAIALISAAMKEHKQ